MLLYYFPIAQNTVNETVSDIFEGCICLYMYVHIFYYFFLFIGLIPVYANLYVLIIDPTFWTGK